MPTGPINFQIDDTLSVDDNLRRYEELLKASDGQLGPILAEALGPLSESSPIDQAAVWSKLFQATNGEAADEGRPEAAP